MSVPTFATLLTEHLARAGISDSELARSIGVRRQTVFRWKEGLVERPRAREDVLRCARKLRLTTEERDLLLLAAGFAPEDLSTAELREQLPETQPVAEDDQGENTVTEASAEIAISAPLPTGAEVATAVAAPESPLPDARSIQRDASDTSSRDQVTDAHPLVGQLVVEGQAPIADVDAVKAGQHPMFARFARGAALLTQHNGRYIPLVLAGGLLFFFGVIWRYLPTNPVNPAPTPTSGVVRMTLNAPTPGPSFPAIHPQAGPDETLILVAPFEGHTLNEQYDVAGRIQEALTEEIASARLISTTIAIWPEAVPNAAYLTQLFATSQAALVIWGEYDSGRVRVNLDSTGNVNQKRDFSLASPSELITVINTTLPQDIRMLALTALGRLLRDQNDVARATNAFNRALALEPADPKTRALLNFYLGHLAERAQTRPALDRAIRYYNVALGENPKLYDALYNRGTVYLNRSYVRTADDDAVQQDLDAAIDDLTMVIAVRPAYLSAYHNRGVARYERNSGDDLANAADDFSHVIAVDAKNWSAYFHRALTAIRAGDSNHWAADLQRVLAIRADYYPAYNGLCWGYALAQDAATALDFCDRAVALDPTGASRDSRAIAYSQLGRYDDAIADFEAYLTWLKAQPADLYGRYRGPLVEEWIALLAQGTNPFTPETLAALR
ncbi:MAG: hypothetical protein R2867_01380 [Caldilineaceae bacterium]